MLLTASPMQLRFPRASSLRRAALLVTAAGTLALAAAGCASPSSSTESTDSNGSELTAATESPRLTFGATAAQALEGKTSSFSLTATPDLVLHAELSSAAYEGKTMVLRGVDPQGRLAWSYPHLQTGRSFDAVIPVFGSRAARSHAAGVYKFQVTAPDGALAAQGKVTFTSPPPVTAAVHASPSAGEAR